MRIRILGWLLVVGFCHILHAQVVTVEPQKPNPGDTLKVTYNPKADGAVLRAAEDVYVMVRYFYTYGLDGFIAKMQKDGDVFKYRFPISKPFSAVQFNFLSMREWREFAYHNTLIYRPDGEPVRGGYQSRISYKGYAEMSAKELELYPDNYAAYLDKWQWAGVQKPAIQLSLVKEDMAKLEKIVNNRLPDLLAALSYGYLLLKQEEKSREMIRTLYRRYSDSRFTAKAINTYSNFAARQEFKGEGRDEVKKLTWELMRRYPSTDFARLWLLTITTDKEFPIAVIENISRKWMADESENPRPRFLLARAYLQRNLKLEQAEILAAEALDLLLQDRLKLYDDIAGSETADLVPSVYRTIVDICLKRHEFSKALAAVKAAQALDKETRPRSYFLEGEVWRMLHASPSKAEAAYLEAMRRGGKEAEEPLKSLYLSQHGNLDGFSEYLASKTSSPSITPDTFKPAPTFEAKLLDGQDIKLSALRGRVVVLNFWFVGCAPCRAEMPGLNRLVEEFQGRGVTFLAFALDDAETVRSFLKDNPFKYQIIPDAEKIAQMYEITAYPTHIIIDSEGRISILQKSGNKNQHEELRPLIESALSTR